MKLNNSKPKNKKGRKNKKLQSKGKRGRKNKNLPLIHEMYKVFFDYLTKLDNNKLLDIYKTYNTLKEDKEELQEYFNSLGGSIKVLPEYYFWFMANVKYQLKRRGLLDLEGKNYVATMRAVEHRRK